ERGLPKKIIDYNDAGQVLREKENFYRFRVNAEPRKMWGYLSDSDDKLFFHGEYLFSFNVEAYYADDQRWLLEKTEEKDHLGNGVFAHTRTTEYHPVYRSFVRSVTEKLSDQAVRRIEYKYIADLSGLPYDDMKKEFIIGPVYSVEEFINGVQVAGERSKYALFPGGKFLPSSKESWGQESGYYTMISNMRYDAAGNLIEQTDRSGLTQSFVWGYGQTYKVAEVRNAAAAAVYHTSFEADGTEFANAFTGKRIFDRAVTGTYFTFTPPAGFSPAAKTTITYRYWDGSNWIPVSASYGGGSFTVPHDKIDEFRLHPANAEMQTWTFYPLIGEGSKCDVNALTTYYEYDALGRLTTVRDSERNITRYVSYLLK
ncbi:MAG TPA: hypothetical protein VEB86_09930, partial [Chryseosolibacter sp.]|nr:hypothetical protein [Chryseosolibacter sp.]